MSRPLQWVVIACLVAAAVLWWRGRGDESAQDRQQKQAIHTADTVYLREVDTLALVRTDTDSFLKADTVFRREVVEKIVERERLACDAVRSACEVRVATRDTRIRTLERRLGGRLFLFGEAGATIPDARLLGTRFEAEAGIALRLDRDLYLQVLTNTDRELRATVRKQLRLF